MTPRNRHWRRRAAYAAIAVLLLVALVVPTVDLPIRRANLAILLDDSTSMQHGLGDAWRQLGSEFNSIPGSTNVSLIRFASRAVLEHPATAKSDPQLALLINQQVVPRFQSIDRTLTDIESAIRLAVDDNVHPADAILLISDAGDTMGDAQAAMRVYGQRVPIFSLLRPSFLATRPLWIAGHSAPRHGKPGNPFWITAELHSTIDADVELVLDTGNGHVLHQRERVAADTPRLVAIRASLDQPGDYNLTLSVADANDEMRVHDTIKRSIAINGPAPVALVSQNGLPMLERAIIADGRQLTRIQPGDLAGTVTRLRPGSVIILDDLPVDALSDAGWQDLSESVHRHGSGLVVLGGWNSFARGGYRQSLLEDLLPTVSEPREDKNTAAIMFVVDKSGSMAQGGKSGIARFAIAGRALTQSVAQLARGDETGLVVFDDTANLVLPLDSRGADAIAFEAALPKQVGGGTQLTPAISLAVEQLSRSPKQQRLLVLLTDGFADEQALAESETLIRNTGVTVMAFAIGQQADIAALNRIARYHDGSVHVVDDLSGLPSMVRGAIEDNRDMLQLTPSRVVATAAMHDWSQSVADWPGVTGYAVTRPRDAAIVLLESEHGDPVFAVWQRGNGVVLTLPAGLGAWVDDWPSWRGWSAFSKLVLQRADTSMASPLLRLDLRSGPQSIRVSAEALTRDLDWSRANHIDAILTDPLGRQTGHRIPATAAGIYEADLPAFLNGAYTVAITHADSRTRQRIFRENLTEVTAARGALQEWFDAGLVQPWNPVVAARLLKKRPLTIEIRTPLLLMALMIYVLLILEERGRSLLSWRNGQDITSA